MVNMLLGDIGDLVPPMMILAIPIVAIVGGIVAGIVRTLSQSRIVENAQRERIAAIQAGIDPSKLPPLPGRPGGEDAALALGGRAADLDYVARRRANGLLVGGVVVLFAGIGLSLFLYLVGAEEGNAWAVGLLPGFVGLGLLVAWFLVRPRERK